MKPVLAQKFDPNKVNFPVLVSPKLDGIRCLAEVTEDGVRLWSRDEKPIVSCAHIVLQLNRLQLPVGTVLDGELYSDTLSFQVFNGTVRRQYHDERSLAIKYHVYDVARTPDGTVERSSYATRYAALLELAEAAGGEVLTLSPDVSVVEHVPAHSAEDVLNFERLWVARGLEGAMVRTDVYDKKAKAWRACGYETEESGHTRRSWGLQKVKSFDEEEFEIIDVVEECDKNGTPKGWAAGFTMRDPQRGVTFNATGIDDRTKQQVWDRPQDYIGQLATVKFFGRSDAGVPRHPNFKGLRPAAGLDSAV